MDCSRDGVHVPFDTDIAVGPFGIVSLCTGLPIRTKNNEVDIDEGDFLTLTGKDYEPNVTIPELNDPLVASYHTQVPFRLIRSYNLSNSFAPKTGYRYDGLYRVIAHWIGTDEMLPQSHHKFALERLAHQEPPPWQSPIFEKHNPRLSETKSQMKSPRKIAGNESTIVSRCISNKKQLTQSESPGCHMPLSIASPLYAGSPVQQALACKLHNTNISIRTDLYDSCHNLQQPVTSRSHVATMNLNSCGPCPKDKEQQESQIQSRSGDGSYAKLSSSCATINSLVPTTARKNNDTSDLDDVAKTQSANVDSLSPDKMLNFIVKQKYHKASKLVIGLANGESSVILRAYKSIVPRTNSSDQTNEKEESTKSEPRNSSCLKQIKQVKQMKITKNNSKDRRLLMRLRLQQTRVSERLAGVAPRQDIAGSKSRTQNRSKLAKLTSKSTTTNAVATTAIKDSKTTRRVRKRKGELANLIIDANIGPIIRGLRNRRLRDTSNLFGNKKRRDNDSAKRSDVGIKGRKGSRVELSSRKSNKRLTQSRYMKAKIKIRPSKDSKNYRERTMKIKSFNAVASVNSSSQTCIRTVRSEEKLNVVPPSQRRRKKRQRSNDSSSDSYRIEDKQIPTKKRLRFHHPRKNVTIERIIMIDATTQCSDRRDVATSIETQITGTEESERSEPCQENSIIKIESIDLIDDVKSEICDDESEQEIAEMLETTCSRNERVSAFVPVNLSDAEFRIARLRSIGFKPIRHSPACSISGQDTDTMGHEHNHHCRHNFEVDEQYNKYANEETSNVGYMGGKELHYQDIEEELSTTDAEKNNKSTRKTRVVSFSMDDETPWYGWSRP